MALHCLFYGLDRFTHPQSNFYFVGQTLAIGGISYLSTALLTSLSPWQAATWVTLTYLISQVTAPLFAHFLQSYQDIAMIPLLGQVLQLSFAAFSAKLLCRLVHISLTYSEIKRISVCFLVALFVTRLGITTLRMCLQRF